MADPVPEMDEFAQTRGADDLFDDEIIPVPAEEQQVPQEVIAPEPEPVPQKEVLEKTAVEQHIPRGETPQRGRGDRGRGRGRNRGRGGGRGERDSHAADQKRSESTARSGTPASVSELDAGREAGAATPEKPQDGAKEKPGQDDNAAGEILIANGAEPQHVPAVRGDRSATGGVRKPKLTEEELSQRIAAAKENAAKKAAAHARAEADQASFMEREKAAAVKRRQELANRRVMNNEREQNRQRKLNALTGREWDSQKREEDYNPRSRGSEFRRGMHGAVSGHTRRDFDDGRSDEYAGSRSLRGRGRGRGGRGRRSTHSPRGERSSSNDPSNRIDVKPTAPGLKDENEFPALPEGPRKAETAERNDNPEKPEKTTLNTKALPSLDNLESSFSPASGTWADQVEE